MIKLLAPNGKPSNLTPEQYKLVRSSAFKKWFGDWENDPANASKIIDKETKEPLVVYHGNRSRIKIAFSVFDIEKDGGVFFTSDEKTARWFSSGYSYSPQLLFEDVKIPMTISKDSDLKDLEKYYKENLDSTAFVDILTIMDEDESIFYSLYTDNRTVSSPLGGTKELAQENLYEEIVNKVNWQKKTEARGFLYKVFLNIKNPYEIDANGKGFWETPFEGVESNATSIMYEIKQRGKNDALIIRNTIEGTDTHYQKKSDTFIVFQPNQIKLADGTNTTFDGSNPDIRFDEGGAIKKVNVVDIKQYTMGGVNYRFVEIAEKKYNKIEVYRQYEDDGKYWGVLLYRRVPRYDFKFSSPMINNLNQLFAYSFRSSDEELFDAVKYKKKPFGSLSHWISYSSEDEIYEKFKVFIAQCSEYNLEYSIINDKESITFQFCQKGTFDELFNIDNLIEDYKNNGFEDLELKGIKKFRYYDLSYFLNNKWDADGVFGFPLTGLILGIPPKFTISILNMWTTYDLSKEYKYSENVIEEKYSVGGEVKTINVLSDIWKWFGIKF